MDDSEARKAAATAATEQHFAAAKHHAAGLVEHARALGRNGIRLDDPGRMYTFVVDEVHEAIDAAKVHGCACQGAAGPAALSLIGELTRLAAEAGR